jgi:hypothetical protein
MSKKSASSDRKMYGLRLDQTLMKEIKHLAVDQAKPMNDLVEEALADLLKKHHAKKRESR